MDVLETLRDRLRERLAERDAQITEMESILATVDSEQRSELTVDEDSRFTELREAITNHNAEIAEIEARIHEGEAIMDEATEARAAASPAAEVDAAKVGSTRTSRISRSRRLLASGTVRLAPAFSATPTR